jgi:beta-glucosidase
LAAFKRVSLAAGASADVSFDIPLEQLMTVQEDGSSKLLRGDYTFTVSSAAPSPRDKALGVSSASAKAKL